MFAATKTFPQSIGIASGTSMSIFGLSPLFLSLIASFKFTPPGETLDIPRFFTFMAVATGVIHLTSAFVFRVNRALEREAVEAAAAASPASAADAERTLPPEHEPLLGPGSTDGDHCNVTPKDPASIRVVPVQEPQEGSTLDLFKDPYVWLLAFWLILIVGTVRLPPHADLPLRTTMTTSFSRQ